MKMILGILLGALGLIAYVIIEKRLGQRACPVCQNSISVDAVNEPCPRCDTLINPLEAD